MNTYALALAILFTGCSAPSEGPMPDTGDPSPGPDTGSALAPGSIAGRVCDPTTRAWLADAQVYTALRDERGHVVDTQQTWSDRDGRWLLEDLPPETTYNVVVQYEDEFLGEFVVSVGDGEAVVLEEPDCLDALTLDVAVVTGRFAAFTAALDAMGYRNYIIVDGTDPDELRDFLQPVYLTFFDLLVFDSGIVEEDILYDTDGSDSDGRTAAIGASLLAWVESGGTVYAIDQSYDLVEQIWPSRIGWVNDDSVPNDAQAGRAGLVDAAVSDVALTEFLGRDSLEVNFDVTDWPVVATVDDSVSVYLSGAVEYWRDTEIIAVSDAPLLASFDSGEGRVIMSSFGMEENVTDDMLLLLHYLLVDR